MVATTTISTASKGRISLSTFILLVHQSCWLAQGVVVSPASPQYHQASSSIIDNTESFLSMAEHEDASLPDRRSVILGTMTLPALHHIFPPPSSASASASASAISTATATATNTRIPEWILDNHVQFPTLALNTVGLSAKETTYALKLAVQSGMTHVDFHPGKERDGVAAYIASHGPHELFLNTKIRKPATGTSPTKAARMLQHQLEEDLKILNVERVDMLMLRDAPDCSVMQPQWKKQWRRHSSKARRDRLV
jgi:hypothetical protein